MLADSTVTTMLPVVDMARARDFYERRLGLVPGGLRPDGKFVYRVGGSTLALFPRPHGTKVEHTAISFQVADIAAAIAELERNMKINEDVLRYMTVSIDKLPEGPSAILRQSDEGEERGERGGFRGERGDRAEKSFSKSEEE